MLQGLVYQKVLPFDPVLMDTWYALNNLMLYIDSLDKVYYCPLKTNRLVDDSFGKEKYKNIESLSWSEDDRTYARMKCSATSYVSPIIKVIIN